MRYAAAALLLMLSPVLTAAESFDVLIRGGTVYDGSSKTPVAKSEYGASISRM